MSAASEARKVLDRAATKFGAGALTTEGDAVAYVNARDALIAAVRAEERARCVALREALESYGRHDAACAFYRLHPCTCGLDAALTGADK